MDILLQYLDIKKNKQVFVLVTHVPCGTIQQAIETLSIIGRVISLIDYLENRDHHSYLLSGYVS